MLPLERVAKVLLTDAATLKEEALRLGISDFGCDPEFEKQGHITIIRSMWFLLPTEQLTELLCVSEEELHALADYCCYAFLGFFLRFLWNQMDADVDSEVDRLSALTEPFVHQALCAHAKMSEDAQKEDE